MCACCGTAYRLRRAGECSDALTLPVSQVLSDPAAREAYDTLQREVKYR